jgi:hypothetical protein
MMKTPMGVVQANRRGYNRSNGHPKHLLAESDDEIQSTNLDSYSNSVKDVKSNSYEVNATVAALQLVECD